MIRKVIVYDRKRDSFRFANEVEADLIFVREENAHMSYLALLAYQGGCIDLNECEFNFAAKASVLLDALRNDAYTDKTLYLRPDVFKRLYDNLQHVINNGWGDSIHAVCINSLFRAFAKKDTMKTVLNGMYGLGQMKFADGSGNKVRWYFNRDKYIFTTSYDADYCVEVKRCKVEYAIGIFNKRIGRTEIAFSTECEDTDCIITALKSINSTNYVIAFSEGFYDECFKDRDYYSLLTLSSIRCIWNRFEKSKPLLIWTSTSTEPLTCGREEFFGINGNISIDPDTVPFLKGMHMLEHELRQEKDMRNRTNRFVNNLRIKDVTFAKDKTTVVLWSDGVRTVVRCQDGEKFDPEKGLAMAISKRFLGNERSYYHTFLHWIKRYIKRK